VEIPDQYVEWGASIIAAIVAWLVRLEARLNARPTRRENEVIADKVARDMNGKFDEIKRMLEKQNEGSKKRDEALADIRTKVAVLRDRAGDDPLGDTGAHRRRI
jgi:hypothetical protein